MYGTCTMYLVKLTLASGMGGSFDFSVVAAFSYSGASFLQWPHLQKKTHDVKRFATKSYI